jgi:toxin HigB-1
MIVGFRSQGTEDVFNGVDSKAARKVCPTDITKSARRKLEAVDSAVSLNDLRAPYGNRLEALKNDRVGQHSIRINDQYRVCFTWTPSGPDQVEIVDFHRG